MLNIDMKATKLQHLCKHHKDKLYDIQHGLNSHISIKRLFNQNNSIANALKIW